MQSKCFPPKRIAQTCKLVIMGLDVKQITTDFVIFYYVIDLKFGEYGYFATPVVYTFRNGRFVKLSGWHRDFDLTLIVFGIAQGQRLEPEKLGVYWKLNRSRNTLQTWDRS